MATSIGMATEKFMDDLHTIIDSDTGWGQGDKFGKKPRIDKIYDRRTIGLGQQKVEQVLIYVDQDIPKSFQLGNGLQTEANQSWHHTISATISVQTNISDVRFREIAGAVANILKNNLIYTGYVKIEIKNFRNLSDQARGNWKGIFDVTGTLLNPTFTHD